MIGFPTCPDCGGSGQRRTAASLVNLITGRDYPECVPCPSCDGEGVVITDELVEAGVQAIAEMWGEEAVHRVRAYGTVRAVLAAMVRHLKAEGGT